MGPLITVDCATGETATRALTPEEETAQQTTLAAAQAVHVAAEEQRSADLALLRERATADPAFAVLCRHLGVALTPDPAEH